MPYVCLGVRGGCFDINTKLGMARISTTKIGFTRPSLIYNHAMTYVYHCICISKRLQNEHTTSSNVPLANTTVDVIPSSLQQLVDSSFASAAAGRQLRMRHRRTVTRIVTKLGRVIVDIKEHLQFKSQLPWTFPSAWTAVFVDVVEPPSCRKLREHAEAKPFTAAS